MQGSMPYEYYDTCGGATDAHGAGYMEGYKVRGSCKGQGLISMVMPVGGPRMPMVLDTWRVIRCGALSTDERVCRSKSYSGTSVNPSKVVDNRTTH